MAKVYFEIGDNFGSPPLLEKVLYFTGTETLWIFLRIEEIEIWRWQKMRIMFYEALVRPKISYDCIVYEVASQSAKKIFDTDILLVLALILRCFTS